MIHRFALVRLYLLPVGAAIGELAALLALLSSPAFAGLDTSELEHGVVRILARSGTSVGGGSGFLLSNSGYVATNEHVVAGGGRFEVHFSGDYAGRQATLVWKSSELDLALLKIAPVNKSPVTLATGHPSKGADVFALGYPGVADRKGIARDLTPTGGILGRVFSGAWSNEQPAIRIIQHSAAVSPGNSGGPLVDGCGRVIGVNTQAALVAVKNLGSGSIERVPEAQTYWASHIQELIDALAQQGIAYQSEGEPCSDVAGVAKPVVQKRDVTPFLRRLEKNQRRITLLAFIAMLGGLFGVIGFRRPREKVIRILESRYTRGARASSGRRAEVQPRHALRRPLELHGRTESGEAVGIALDAHEISAARGGVCIGRHPELVDYVIASSELSRRHARITMSKGKTFIEDLNSTNGTTVNDRRLKPFVLEPLEPGDHLGLGRLKLFMGRGRID